MSTSIYVPNGDITANGPGTFHGQSSPYYPALSDGSDGTYWDDPTGLQYLFQLGPGSGQTSVAGSTITVGTCTLRCSSDSNDGSDFAVTVFESNGTTALTNTITITPTSFGSPSFGNVTGTFSLTAAGQIGNNWVNAHIKVEDGGSGGGDWYVSEAKVTLSYTVSTNTYTYTPTGGISFGGSAPLEHGKDYPSAGGISFGGSATKTLGKDYLPSGGIAFAGHATLKGTWSYVWAGGLSLAGSAPLTLGKQYLPTSGLSLSGTGPKTLGRNYQPSGGISFAGAATLKGTWSYVWSGGIDFAGSDTFVEYFPTGGIILNGSAPKEQGHNYLPTGGIAFAGTAPTYPPFYYVPNGGIVFSGQAGVQGSWDFIPSGGLTLGGSAVLSQGYIPTGGLTLAGTAGKALDKDYTPAGGLTLVGSAPLTLGKNYLPHGGIVFSGAAVTKGPWSYIPHGGIIFSGAAVTLGRRGYLPSGGIAFGGTAAVATTSTAPNLLLGGRALLGRGYLPTGGILLSGMAPHSYGKSVVFSGGIIMSGASPVSFRIAVTDILRPTRTLYNVWAVNAFCCIDDRVLDPAAGDGQACVTHNQTTEGWELSPPANYYTEAAVTLALRVQTVSETFKQLTLIVYADGLPLVAQTVQVLPEWSWQLVTIPGTLTQAQLANLVVTARSPDAFYQNEVYVDVLYLAVSGYGEPASLSESISLGSCSCPPYSAILPLSADAGQPINVDQPPGGGSFYPFLWQPHQPTFRGIDIAPFVYPPTELNALIADAYLYYNDPAGLFVSPFYLNWLYGFGDAQESLSDSTSIPGPTHELDAQIVDTNGRVVFDSTRSTDFRTSYWDNRLQIVEWYLPESILRLVRHVAWPFGTIPPRFSVEFEPHAQLDPRAVYRSPSRVLAIQVGNVQLTGQLELDMGYNINLEVTPQTPVDGGALVNQIVIQANPGDGLGQAPCDCSSISDTPLRTISGVSPTALGAFLLSATGKNEPTEASCYSIEPPGSLTQDSPAVFTPTPYTLAINNSCGPCCECEYFVNSYTAIGNMNNQFKALGKQAETVRDQYAANLDRWNAQKACRESNQAQLTVLPDCPCALTLGGSYCNPSSSCLGQLELRFTLRYYRDGVELPPDEVAVGVVSGQTFITSSALNGGTLSPYALGGTYPVYSAFYDFAGPHQPSAIQFRLQVAGCQNGDTLEVNYTVHTQTLPPSCPLQPVSVPSPIRALWPTRSGLPPIAYLQQYAPLIPPNDSGICACD